MAARVHLRLWANFAWEWPVLLRRIQRTCVTGILALGMTTGLYSIPAVAKNSTSSVEELTRKVKTKVPPAYPELARRMNIRGTVRVWVVVSPNGNIKETKGVGGNPILLNSALDALKKWKFEAAPSESEGVVEFHFEDAGN